ncbi:MAG TPA: universal stress protein [Pyrinomonadaceae bacterium]|nr:universal stress protein [Pyrinomonadaceae bacterium]
MKILIAYDGSDCAEAALDDLQRAGLPPDAEALVVSVTEVWLPPPPPSVYEVVEEAAAAYTPAELQRHFIEDSPTVVEAHALAEKARARLRKNFPGWEVRAESFYGSPAREVLRVADEWGPDLVVVGSHGRSALGRFVMGSVSQKVLNESRSSVRVARGRVEVEPTPARVLVGIDGSRGAEAAVREVAARLWPRGSEARVCVVEDPPIPLGVGRFIPPLREVIEEENRAECDWVCATVGSAVRQLSDAGLVATSLVATGDPRRVLVEEAERWGADSIFVGSRGTGSRLGRYFLGSVSAAVAARAHCSVEVTREPELPAEG